jgi:glycosyltransferase involved in cell wall biosynthesis
MMITCTALTKNPLPARYAKNLQAALGEEFQVVNLTELQRTGVRGILQGMRRITSRRVVLPIEDESVQAILPILQMLAALTRGRELEVITPKLQRVPFGRSSVLWIGAQLAFSSLRNAGSALASFVRLARLNAARRIVVRAKDVRRVLYINANLWLGVKIGGSVGHISGVINALLRRSHAVTFAACGGPLMLDEQAGYLELAPPRIFGFPVELNGYRFHAMALPRLRQLLRSGNFDFIYQRLSAANYLGVQLSREFRIPLVTEYNGSEVWISRNWGRPLKFQQLAESAERAMLRHSHLVVTVSDVLRDELVERGVEPARIVNYPNCIDERLFAPSNYSAAQCAELRDKWGIARDSVVVAFVGTFGQWHGVDILAAAIEKLALQQADWLQRQRVRFMLIGDGLKMSEVRARVNNPEVAKFCVLTGLVPQGDAPAYLAASDVLVSPHVANPDGSKFFGSPTKLFEYMAMGKGIVASDLDQIGQVLSPGLRLQEGRGREPIVTDPRLALLTSPGDVDELVAAIRFMIDNPAWRDALGANARREVLAKYTWSHHVDAILQGLARQDQAGTSAGK